MRKVKVILILVGVVAIAFFFERSIDRMVSQPVIWAFGDVMDWDGRWLTGRNGIDCGRVRIGGDPHEATDCALTAQKQGRPFRVRYDIQGIDSEVAGGIVRTSSGQLYALSFDGNIAGGGNTTLLLQRVSKVPCPEPIHLWVNPLGRINCFQQQLSYPSSIMSPNMEPY